MSFLNFSGSNNKEGIYYVFDMEGEKPLKEAYRMEIADPTIDNSFKRVFYTKPEITKSFLNSLLFPRNERIKDLMFLPSECPGQAGSYSEGSIRMDCPCKCKLEPYKKYPKIKTDNLLGLYYDDKEIIVDIEMQIGVKPNLDDTLMKYLRNLCHLNEINKILLLVILYTPGPRSARINKGYITSFGKEAFKSDVVIEKREDCIIYQLDLNYCYTMWETQRNIYLMNKIQKLENPGKEWIKFLSIPIWCSKSQEKYYHFPPLDHLVFKDDNIKTALSILADKNWAYEKSFTNQKYMEQIIENYSKVTEERNEAIEEKNKAIKDKVKAEERANNIEEEYKKLVKEYEDYKKLHNMDQNERKKNQ